MAQHMPAPAPPITIGRPAMLLAPVSDQMRVDSLPGDLCGCCHDGETCCLAFCCSCCAHGVLCHDIEEKGYCLHCMSWIVASSCICPGVAPPLLGMFARIRLRDKYGLAGDRCEGMHPKPHWAHNSCWPPRVAVFIFILLTFTERDANLCLTNG